MFVILSCLSNSIYSLYFPQFILIDPVRNKHRTDHINVYLAHLRKCLKSFIFAVKIKESFIFILDNVLKDAYISFSLMLPMYFYSGNSYYCDAVITGYI